jgi:hypothetical protein
LPESIGFAAYEYMIGPLLENLQRVGKQLRPPLDDRHSTRRGTDRVLYLIDDAAHRVTVVGVFGRADAYRSLEPQGDRSSWCRGQRPIG